MLSMPFGKLRWVFAASQVTVKIFFVQCRESGNLIMLSRRRFFRVVASVLFVVSLALSASAQQRTAAMPVPSPTPATEQEAHDAQDDIKVVTEEVRIPVFATDEHGRFDPSLEMQDVLVLEDDVPQEIQSVRRIPASILLLVGTGGELNPAMRTSISRAVARNLVMNLREGDEIAVLQFSNRAQLVHGWTNEKDALERSLRTKLIAGRGSRLSQAIIDAALFFESRPVGNRHLVLITDGVETSGRMDYKEAMKVLDARSAETPEAKAQTAEAIRELNATQATVHIISYTSIAQDALQKQRKDSASIGVTERQDAIDYGRIGIDPTLPPGMSRGGPSVGAAIRFDPQMKRLRKAYEKAMKRSEQRLSSLADETGGRIWLPSTPEEMFTQAREVAREIGSQYVVTYKPKRPLDGAPPSEYRRLVVAPRRIGLRLRARRGYVVAAVR